MGKVRDITKLRYLLPNIITGTSMACGILSIMTSIEGRFMKAAWILVISLLCDMTDGRVARFSHTTSSFGGEFDSLSDLVAFGIAPAFLIYTLLLERMGALGKVIAVLYILCSACRLARFNVLEQRGVSNENFLGLPTPAAAAVIIFFILNYELTGPEEIRLNFRTIPLLMKIMPGFFKAMPFIMVLLSLLMVSNVPYYSFKVMSLSRPQVIEAVCLALVLLGLIIAFPQNVFLLIFACYIVAGPLVSLAQSRHSQMPRAESAP